MTLKIVLRFMVMFLTISLSLTSCLDDGETFPPDVVMDGAKKKKEEKKDEPRFLTLKSGIVVEVLPSGEYVYQGDMILSDKQLKLLEQTGPIYDNIKQEEVGDSGRPG